MSRIDRWLLDEFRSNRSDLAVFRILISLFLLLSYVPTGMWITDAPFAFFSPPAGFAALFTDWPGGQYLQALNVGFMISTALLLVGWKTPLASIGVTVFLGLLNSWDYASGKINHDILLVVTPLVMTFSGWGDAISIDSKRRSDADDLGEFGSASLAILALIIGFAMFTSGWAKLTTGWLTLETQATLGHCVSNAVLVGRTPLFIEFATRFFPPMVWEVGDWCVTILELAFLPAVCSRRFFRYVVALACVFHVGVWLLFDIAFSFNVVVYSAFADWGSVRQFLKHRQLGLNRPTWLRIGGAICVGLAGIFLFQNSWASGVVRHFVDRGVIIAGGAIAVCFLSSSLRRDRSAAAG